MSVESVAATQVALTQAQVQAEVATRLLKVAQDVGAPQQMLELVKQTAEAAVENMVAAASATRDGLDVYV